MNMHPRPDAPIEPPRFKWRLTRPPRSSPDFAKWKVLMALLYVWIVLAVALIFHLIRSRL